MRESNVCRVASGRDVGHDVREAVAADVVKAGPGVGADFAAARDVVEHELSQRVALDVGDPSHPHPLGRLVALDGDRDDRLVPGLRPPTLVCRAPTYVSSISTAPASNSRPGSTIPRRSLCSHVQAVS